jgi:hypothetical protein
MKLKHKERHGSQVKKTYDMAQIPHQRLQQSPDLSAVTKHRLKAEYTCLNPPELKRQIERLRTTRYGSKVLPTSWSRMLFTKTGTQ